MLKFLKSLFSGLPEYVPNPAATPAQKWALACSAVLTHINGDQHEWLHGGPPGAASASENAKAVLASGWDVKDRAGLLQILDWLEREGHRIEYERLRQLFERKGEWKSDCSELVRDEAWAQGISAEDMLAIRKKLEVMVDFWKKHRSLLAWDLGRAISVCRWGASAGYHSDDEAWQRITAHAGHLRGAFGSWAELGDNYQAGRAFWSGEEDHDTSSAIEALLDAKNTNSPWLLNRWA